MIYQVRQKQTGRKLLERDDPEEIRHYLNGHPAKQHIEIWVLAGMPGELIDITPAEQYLTPVKVE